ncbi:hypothetical protein [Gimesia chilikensis]|uniref:hypothetical protein n=1 Tax=Gimesia chilikensis TaxID=2605989 RepID=UPI00118C85B1|nr:hypothetical protein [Gimesia chilikensis]QDT82960.1 hypothetical protein MalM14_05900 [Gimesia chilikensis]
MRALFIATSICLMFLGTTPSNTAQAEDKPAKPTLKTVNWPVAAVYEVHKPHESKQAIQMKQPFYPELTANEQKIHAALKAPTTIELPGVPLKQVIEEIQNQHHINFFFSAIPLKAEGISIEEPVNASLSGVPLKSALKIILKPLGLAYEIDQEVLKITTQAEVDRNLRTRTYPVGDLCTSEKDFIAIQNAILTGCQLRLKARKQRWSAEGLVLQGPRSAPAPYQNNINPAMTFVPQCQALVVNETEEIHEKIVELLTQLRQVRQIQMRAVPETN